MRRARDIPAAIINLRIAVAESMGANRDAILREANIGPGFYKVSISQGFFPDYS